ncbi:hypothetical protein GF339_21410 [candidate division KSB3 bacterium]|uniref:Uncharacterized protein n=1 Tax=candidate division KSB3 bacterium TaxID=2044937 RepID=A0A9D5JZM8_9BACT|nr:hypothetical protein [candidate division KSB3 bacterium]MBD3327158.1 hypothetical protein [candidate division KSB3 bacterium]
MIPKLDNLVEGWFVIPLKSGLFFWVGGGLAYIWHRGGWKAFWKTFSLIDLEKTNLAVVLLFVGFVLIMAVASSLLKHFDDVILRALEGYYWPSGVLIRWTRWQDQKWREKETRRQTLTNDLHNKKELSRKERDELADLERQLMHLPEKDNRLPTRLGNTLRGYEQRPREKYGLDAFVCWPRLWILLPKEVREEVSLARNNLDTAIHTWIWSLLFLVWGIWALWAIVVGLVLTFFSYRWILQAARIYGQLVEASFDIHRFALYESLHWPLPTNPAEERPRGKQLTAYLWRGSEEPKPEFTVLSSE